MSAHSDIGASGAYRWTVCTGQPNMVKGLPNMSSYLAALGTVGHSVGERCLLEHKNAHQYLGQKFVEEVEGKPTDFVIDQNMVDAVQLYLDHVRSISEGYQLHVESRVDLSKLWRGMYGTADLWFVRGTTLVVRDYKHGEFTSVEVENCIQLAYYAIGAVFRAYESGYTITDVEMGIVQPRYAHVDGPIRTWSLTIDELNKWAVFLATKARETEENPKLVAGPHCAYCIAENCRPRAHYMIDLLTFDKPIGELTDAELERFLENKTMLKDGFEKLDSVTLQRMKTGAVVSKKYKLTYTSPRASVPNPAAFYETLPLYGLIATDYQKQTPPAPLSRTEAIKKSGEMWPLISPFYVVPEKGVKIVPVTARGQAIAPTNSKEALQTTFESFQLPPTK